MSEYDGKNYTAWWITGSVLVFFIVLSLFLSCFVVPAGKVGVITRFGAVNRVAYPGFGWKIPFAEGITKMDTRTQKVQIDVGAASKDLQAVSATIAVNYHLQGDKAVIMYQNVGTDYDNLVILPAIQNAFKATTAHFTAEQLINTRDAVSIEAESKLQEQLSQYSIVVENLNIINFDFSPEFNSAIEQKQVAQQNVEKAKQELAKAQIDAQTKLVEAQGTANSEIEKARGQSEAQKLIAQGMGLTPEYLQYLFLQTWDGKLPVISSSNLNTLLDVNEYLVQP